MRNHTKHEPLILKAWQRTLALVLAVVFLIAVAWYALRDRTGFVAASGCTDAPVGCSVQVTVEPNAAVTITLVVIAAVWLLIAVSGRVPGFDFAGLGMHLPGQDMRVEFVSPGELPVESGLLADDQGHAIASSHGGLDSRDIYLSMPLGVRLAADNTWSSTFPRSLLSEAAHDVHPGRADGSDAWFIGAVSPLGEKLWLRVVKRT